MNEDNIHSEEYQEIISKIPSAFIRLGSTIILIVFLLLLFISWFIKYPDIITGQIRLSTELPSITLVSKANGEITKLFVSDKSWVSKGEPIAEIKGILNEEAIDYLSSISYIIDSIFKTEFYVPPIIFKDSGLFLGNLEVEYQNLKQDIYNLNNIYNEDYYQIKVNFLNEEVKYFRTILSLSKQQLIFVEKDLSNYKEIFEANKILYNRGTLEKIEFFEEEKKYHEYENELIRLKKLDNEYKISIVKNEQEIGKLNFERKENIRLLKESIQSSLSIIKSYISTWKESNVIYAPFSGYISYVDNLSLNEYIELGRSLFHLVPNDSNYTGFLSVSSYGIGKIKVGQRVRIKLDKYPFQEYGYIEGEVKSISLVESKGGHRVGVDLPKSLVSSFGLELEFTPNMSGDAEIITEDIRLLERFFTKFRTLLD